jgi:hypothetical protein
MSDLVEDFFVLRESKCLQFREDSLAIYRYFKRSTVSLDERRNQAELSLDGGLQTCSLRQVVSFNAVLNLNVHEVCPFCFALWESSVDIPKSFYRLSRLPSSTPELTRDRGAGR